MRLSQWKLRRANPYRGVWRGDREKSREKAGVGCGERRGDGGHAGGRGGELGAESAASAGAEAGCGGRGKGASAERHDSENYCDRGNPFPAGFGGRLKTAGLSRLDRGK